MATDYFSQLSQAIHSQTEKIESIADHLEDMDLKVHNERIIYDTITTDQADFVFSLLPKHNAEHILSLDYTISTVEIVSFSSDESGQTPPFDYTAILIMKVNGKTSVSEVLKNAQPDYVGGRIYIMNPDLDITEYDILHLFIFYDGFHYCCIAAGYDTDVITP